MLHMEPHVLLELNFGWHGVQIGLCEVLLVKCQLLLPLVLLVIFDHQQIFFVYFIEINQVFLAFGSWWSIFILEGQIHVDGAALLRYEHEVEPFLFVGVTTWLTR